MSENQKRLNLKLVKILGLLDVNQRMFEEIGKQIKDIELRNILLDFVKNDREYSTQLLSNLANEFKSSLNNLKEKWQTEDKEKPYQYVDYNDFFEKCRNEESAFEKAYREVLNSWYLGGGLRKMIQYQLNEIKILFLKIRINKMERSCSFSKNVLLRN